MSSYRDTIRQDVQLIEETLLILYKKLWKQRGDTILPEPSEDELVPALLTIATQSYIVQALYTCDFFRAAAIKYEYSLIDFVELSAAISNLGLWLFSSTRHPVDGVDLLSVRMASSLCLHLSRIDRMKQEVLEEQEDTLNETRDTRDEDASSVDSDDELGLFSDSATTSNLAVISLHDLRETHKKEMKGTRIVVRDGKYSNCRGVFCHWSGTIAYVRFDTEPSKKVALPVERTVSILSWSQIPIASSSRDVSSSKQVVSSTK